MFWLPSTAPSTVVLSPTPPDLFSPRASVALPRDEPRSFAPYEAIGPAGYDQPILMIGQAGSGAMSALVPLDADLPHRLDALVRLWRRLTSGHAEPPGVLTAQRRRRLVETLRALDGLLDGASTREVAGGLFGEDRVPSGPEWKAHDLRSRAKRLIGAGRALMNGGYRSLLRPPR